MRLGSRTFAGITSAAIALLLVTVPAFSQEVISARSGAVHFIEGAVSINNQPLDRKSGAFPIVKEGSTLRTAKGRAEVLLMPGAFLRLDENTAIRMTAAKLSDTQLEFLSGSIIVDLSDALPGTALRIANKDAHIEFSKAGVYRVDSDTGVLQVYSGEARVSANGQKVNVDTSHLFFFSLGLETNKLGPTEDEFYDWARDRNQAISDENQLAEQTKGDPGDVDDTFAGAPYLGPGAGTYGSGSPLPTIPSPLVPPVPYPSQPGLGAYGAFGTYGYSQYLNPSFAYAPAPYLLTGFPQILVVPYRPGFNNGYRNNPNWSRIHSNPNWPRTTTPVWHSVSTGSLPVLPRMPVVTARPAISPLGTYRPIAAPRVGGAVVPRAAVPMVHPAIHK